MNVKAYFLEEIGQQRAWLRRFCWSERSKCINGSYHNAMVAFGDFAIVWEECVGSKPYKSIASLDHLKPDADDSRWPNACEKCGYLFARDDQFQVFSRQLYRRQDTGEITTTEDAAPGALWYADWSMFSGPDGHCLMAKCPDGHDWCIDGRASNCTMKDDDVHRCWIRHGDPPMITVDKNGHSCQAGAGSIQTQNWHGFLRNGEFVQC